MDSLTTVQSFLLLLDLQHPLILSYFAILRTWSQLKLKALELTMYLPLSSILDGSSDGAELKRVLASLHILLESSVMHMYMAFRTADAAIRVRQQLHVLQRPASILQRLDHLKVDCEPSVL